MKFDPQIHHRRSIRLPGYDYSLEGAYFITICTQGKVPLVGQVGKRTPLSKIVRKFKTFSTRRINKIQEHPGNLSGSGTITNT
jgi:hypothetical protein